MLASAGNGADFGILDTSKLDIFFPVLLNHLELFWKRCMVDVGCSIGVGESLFAVHLGNTLSKDKNIHPF